VELEIVMKEPAPNKVDSRMLDVNVGFLDVSSLEGSAVEQAKLKLKRSFRRERQTDPRPPGLCGRIAERGGRIGELLPQLGSDLLQPEPGGGKGGGRGSGSPESHYGFAAGCPHKRIDGRRR